MPSYALILLTWPIYFIFELIFRSAILIFFENKHSLSRKLLTPHWVFFFSPGYWIAFNCKNSIKATGDNKREIRGKLIANYNLFNFFISLYIFLTLIIIYEIGLYPHVFFMCFIFWRFISRSIEIIYAFTLDILSPKQASSISNFGRMRLALVSYIEIFIFSASLYACMDTKLSTFKNALMGSFNVGTFANVAFTAEKISEPILVFVQIFATLSLVILSIAGYIGKIKELETGYMTLNTSTRSENNKGSKSDLEILKDILQSVQISDNWFEALKELSLPTVIMNLIVPQNHEK